MKKGTQIALLAVIVAAIFSVNASAGHIGDFNHTIKINVDCSHCPTDANRKIKVRLYADGQPVPNTEVTLDNKTGFIATYDNMPVFRTEKGAEEIKYQAGVSEAGDNYRILNPKKVTHEKITVNKWLSVSPENLQDGHDYVFLTENWNYEENQQGKYVLMNGTVELEQATPQADYEIIDGKKSYYSLTTEPSANAIWKLAKITADDPDYGLYPNTWLFTNNQGKRLVLSDFNNGEPNEVIWRYSGKNGHSDVDNTENSNKITILPVSDNRGRFRMAATLSENGALVDPTYYVGVNHFYAIQPQTEIDYSAQFIAFEYVESREVEIATTMTVDADLCPYIEPATPGNPNTAADSYAGTAAAIVASLIVGSAVFIKKRR